MAEEKQFENKVKAFLNDHGCWYLKTWSNGIQREGVPDILACVNGYFVAIELKASNGTVKPLQRYNIEKIRESEGVAIVLYPDEFERFKKMIMLLLADNVYGKPMQYKFKGKESK